jgi:phosphatidylserine/phosphatidylglycerophosphate/cardiolipin synthase-like enzyme
MLTLLHAALVLSFSCSVWHLILREPWRGSLWYRNHRKILIVDSTVGFCGGMNVSVDYFGRQDEPSAVEHTPFVDAALDTPSGAGTTIPSNQTVSQTVVQSVAPLSDADEYVGGTGKFRDTHLQVRGPAVAHLERVSLDTFHEAFVGVGGVQEGAAHAEQTRARLLAAREIAPSSITGVGSRKRSPWYPARTPALLATAQAAKSAAAAQLTTSSSSCDTEPAASCPVPDSHFAAVAAQQSQRNALASSSSDAAASGASSDAPGSDLFVQVLPSNVWRNMRLIQRAMLLTVQSARSSILITNPYFFPPPRLFRALQRASERGVSVSILMAGEGLTDVPVTRWASQHIYHQLLKSGVRIYELQSATLHAKTVTIDGLYSSIGSFNWDRSVREECARLDVVNLCAERFFLHICLLFSPLSLSARRNLEVNLTCLDPDLAQTLEQHFAEDLRGSRQVTVKTLKERNMFQRLLHRVAYWIMRYL